MPTAPCHALDMLLNSAGTVSARRRYCYCNFELLILFLVSLCHNLNKRNRKKLFSDFLFEKSANRGGMACRNRFLTPPMRALQSVRSLAAIADISFVRNLHSFLLLRAHHGQRGAKFCGVDDRTEGRQRGLRCVLPGLATRR